MELVIKEIELMKREGLSFVF